jgi:hypothetical protein
MAVEGVTDFDPGAHGFHFRNRYSGLDILAEIDDGLGAVAGRLQGPEFWAGWGLCGGMAWHALDRFYARNPVPATTVTPGTGSALFRVLVMRQIDSLRGGALITKCLRWQSRNARRRWWDPRPPLHRMTLRSEWPKVRGSINRGYPASVTLVRTKTNPSENHQVIAVNYRADPVAGRAEIGLYDPNHPGQEPSIILQLTGADAGEVTQSSGEPLRAFFSWPYDRTRRSPRFILDQ